MEVVWISTAVSWSILAFGETILLEIILSVIILLAESKPVLILAAASSLN